MKLLGNGEFPRIWMPTMAERDLRQLLVHRDKLVRMRTRVKCQLQHIALNQGCRRSTSCGAAKGASCWKAFSWNRGQPDAEMIC